MPRIQQCLISIEVANSLIDVVKALGIKVPGGELGFLCPGCEKPLRPHGGASPHFEHVERNPECPLSYKPDQPT